MKETISEFVQRIIPKLSDGYMEAEPRFETDGTNAVGIYINVELVELIISEEGAEHLTDFINDAIMEKLDNTFI